MIRTDFSKVERLLLIYPENVRGDEFDYQVLAPFYDKLIALVPEDIHVIVFVRSRRTGERLRELRHNLEYVVLESFVTIWLRDVAGFNCGDRIVKPRFRPQYYRGAFKTADRINRDIRIIHEVLNKSLVEIPLVWDGGNLVTNSSIGIVTKRILRDNPGCSADDVTALIKAHLGIELVLVPELQRDVLAHTDMYAAFVDDQTALLSEYPQLGYGAESQYVENIKRELLKRGIEVVRVKENPGGMPAGTTASNEEISSAKGTYVNFLQLNGVVILPEYSSNEKDQALDYNGINQDILAQFGRVITINCDDLAAFGGVLHCISFAD